MVITGNETMPIADVYAESLLAVGREQGNMEELAAEVDQIVQYMGRDPDFAHFLTAATIDDESRRDSLERLFRGRLKDPVLNLLHVLNDRGRLPLLRSIGRCVQLRMEAAHHQKEVIVETAVPLTDDLRAAIRQQASAITGKEAILIEQVRPELIGGFVLHIDDTQIDASVASRLAALRRRLSDRGTEMIHGNAARLVEA